jgi:hypothetical protein
MPDSGDLETQAANNPVENPPKIDSSANPDETELSESKEDRDKRLVIASENSERRMKDIQVRDRLDRIERITAEIKENHGKIVSLTQSIRAAQESSGVARRIEELEAFNSGPMRSAQKDLDHYSGRYEEIDWFTLNPLKHIQRFWRGRQRDKAMEKRDAVAEVYWKTKEDVDKADLAVRGVLQKELEILSVADNALRRELADLEKEDKRYVEEEIWKIRSGMSFDA